jgi:DNA polymerase elongation subunit (family B)
MTTIFFDIETVPTSDPEVIEEITANIKPPATMSKPETIAKWEAENKERVIEEKVNATGLDGGLGSIICIGYAINDGAVDVLKGASESYILTDFFAVCEEATQLHYTGGIANNPPLYVGHNIIGFDLRFIWQRAVILGIEPPARMPFDRQAQMKGVYDTMVQWNPDREKRVSFDGLCRRLGVPSPKSDMDGSQVWDFFKAGRIDRIANYCAADVLATRLCYKKMVFSK